MTDDVSVSTPIAAVKLFFLRSLMTFS